MKANKLSLLSKHHKDKHVCWVKNTKLIFQQ